MADSCWSTSFLAALYTQPSVSVICLFWTRAHCCSLAGPAPGCETEAFGSSQRQAPKALAQLPFGHNPPSVFTCNFALPNRGVRTPPLLIQIKGSASAIEHLTESSLVPISCCRTKHSSPILPPNLRLCYQLLAAPVSHSLAHLRIPNAATTPP